MKIAIVGGGLTGLVAGYRLSQKGHKITIFEKEKELGGLAGGFKLGGTYLEKTYHHIFRKDKYIIDLIEELGLGEKLKWHKDKTAMVYGNNIYSFASAIDLLKFKPLGLADKIRLGLVKIYLEKENNWEKFKKITATRWMEKWCGKRAYKIIWEPLLRGKFGGKYKRISMAWMWARINSRGSGGLGYLEGGCQQIINELVKRIKGEIKIKTEFKNQKGFGRIINTGPIKGIDYLPAVVMVFTSKQNLSKYYWHNVVNPESPFVVFIQHTNLTDKANYGGEHIYYLGAYGKEKIEGWLEYLKKIFPKFEQKLIKQKFVFSFRYAQHIVACKYQVPSCKVNERLYRANFAQIYPEDRGMNLAVREGEKIAKMI